MEVLEDERKFGFAGVGALYFADGAGRRVKKKCAIVGFTIVVASRSKAQRAAEDQDGGRKGPPSMMSINERGVKWGNIRPPFIEAAFEGAESCVKAEASQNDDNGKDLEPPRVASQGAAKRLSTSRGGPGCRH
jgi:hypothetical protein